MGLCLDPCLPANAEVAVPGVKGAVTPGFKKKQIKTHRDSPDVNAQGALRTHDSASADFPGVAVAMSSLGAVDSLIEIQYGLSVLNARGVSWVVAALAFPLSLLVWFTLSWVSSPLRKYPGPFLAGMVT
jgi:hypothetical protein